MIQHVSYACCIALESIFLPVLASAYAGLRRWAENDADTMLAREVHVSACMGQHGRCTCGSKTTTMKILLGKPFKIV